MTDPIAQLRQAEAERQRAIAARKRATYELARLLCEAKAQGITVVEMSEALDLNRGQLYQLMALVGKEE